MGLCVKAAMYLDCRPSKSLVVTWPMSLGPTMVKIVLKIAKTNTITNLVRLGLK
jgi:hypothetical protein